MQRDRQRGLGEARNRVKERPRDRDTDSEISRDGETQMEIVLEQVRLERSGPRNPGWVLELGGVP